LTAAELERLPFTAAHRKILHALQEKAGEARLTCPAPVRQETRICRVMEPAKR
jgi:hypothetical protein